MPILVDHYFDHNEENKNTTLISFLYAHYCIEDGTDIDAAEDKELPFKSTDQINNIHFSSLTPPFISYCIQKTFRLKIENHIDRDETHLPNQYLDAIWQPPRFC